MKKIKLLLANLTSNDVKSLRWQQIYLSVITLWILIFGYIWSLAPALIPKYGEVANQILTYFKFDANPSFDSSFPFFHLNADNYDFYEDMFSSLYLTSISMIISIVLSMIFAYSYTITFKIYGKFIPIFKPIINLIIRLRFMSILGFLFVFMSTLHQAEKVKIALLVFSIVPFFTLSLVSMINRIDKKEYDLWTTLKYNRWEQLYEIIIYGKLDYVIEAIGINFAMGWIMMTLAESKSMADGGLGVLLFKADKYNDLVKVFALQIIILILGSMFDYLIKQLRYKLFPYTALAEKK